MLLKSHHLLRICLIFCFTFKAHAVTLTFDQNNYSTSANITTNGVGISSSFSGSISSPNQIRNLHIITTGNSGATSSAYAIRSSGSYNQVINEINASIITTGSSGRGISIANNSSAFNSGSIITQGTSSYGLYGGGDDNSLTNAGSILTNNSSAYGIYINGDNNYALNSGTINSQTYGIYGNGNNNDINKYSQNTIISN